jgi:WD40 repeat protein
MLAVADIENRLYLLEVRTGRKKQCGTGKNAPVVALAFAPYGKTLAVTDSGEAIQLFATATGAKVGRLWMPDGRPKSLAFSADGRVVAAGGSAAGNAGTVYAWESATGKR